MNKVLRWPYSWPQGATCIRPVKRRSGLLWECRTDSGHTVLVHEDALRKLTRSEGKA